jgi:A/G-specific adenine glycosylase
MMDLGATICIPKAARCGACPVASGCRARKAGIQNELPRKAVKTAKPQKHGYVYWITDGQGHVLLERRPETAMMGGMLALPVSEWRPPAEELAHDFPFISVLNDIKAEKRVKVLHSFTHFNLTLYGFTATARKTAMSGDRRYKWVSADAAATGLPSLFAKAVKMFASTGT